MTISGRDAELAGARTRAYSAVTSILARPDDAARIAVQPALFRAAPDEPEHMTMPVGTLMTELLGHGGLYTLADSELMESRFTGMMAGAARMSEPPKPEGKDAGKDEDGARTGAAGKGGDAKKDEQRQTEDCPKPGAMAGMMADMRAAMVASRNVNSFFFYHLVNCDYPLHSQLVSYLSFPNRHLRSPITVPGAPSADGPMSAEPYGPEGKTYHQFNTPSREIPAAVTFIGQFIDHDLTLNAMNLLDLQAGPDVRDQASPMIDLDSVYGPRLDDGSTFRERVVPMKNGEFCLRRIANTDVPGKWYDVCRQQDDESCSFKALIGDKRNDENQLILQVHILAMRLHNHFMRKHRDFAKAKCDTILHWQAMVATYYLPLIAQPKAIDAVKKRLLRARETLCHRPGLTICGGTTLGMPHEFAIGFRFGHSQLRSEYELVPPKPGKKPIRLFDSLAPATTGGVQPDDLQGGKRLVPDHVVDWHHFASDSQTPPVTSNLIDIHVNEVVFSLPESTIPDDVKLVGNLPARNLLRSNSLGLCAGEDLADCYKACYPELGIARVAPDFVEPDPNYRPLFQFGRSCENGRNPFRTPLWYYLLREAEHDRLNAHSGDKGYGRLGMVGSLLVAEVLLSGIRYARVAPPQPAKPSKCRSQQIREGKECSIFLDSAWKARFEQWTADKPALQPFLGLVDLVRNNAEPECC